MLPFYSNIKFTNGIHKLKLMSINDDGGYTVIGITNNHSSTDYYYCVGAAGNGFITKREKISVGEWSN